MVRTFAGAVLAGLLLSGCHPKTTSGGIEVYENIWERTDRDLRFRAAMALHCAAASIQLTLVQRQGRFPTVVHAQACGNQALYSRKLRRHHGKYTDQNSTWLVEGAGPVTSTATLAPPPLAPYDGPSGSTANE